MMDVSAFLSSSVAFDLGYNTRVVLMGVTLLGVAAGVVGTFTFLRRRSLLSDALSHATLPGICLAFLLGGAVGFDARSLPLLLTGAAVFGVIGLTSVQWLNRHTRLNEDASIAVVLSAYFGLGVVLLTLVQTLGSGNRAGLESFIMGQTAAMSAGEAIAIAALAFAAILVTVLLFKELMLYSFDPDFAQGQGWSVDRLDYVVAGLTVFVTVIGLQSVGLILIVALLIIPPVSARFWTDQLSHLVVISGCIGGLSAFSGAYLSSLIGNTPTGALIVCCAGVVFVISMAFAPRRGVIGVLFRRHAIQQKLTQTRQLVALLNLSEEPGAEPGTGPGAVTSAQARAMKALAAKGLVDNQRLTATGQREALRVRDNLRLWEEYLYEPTGQLPVNCQWGVDDIHATLPEDSVQRLQQRLSERDRESASALSNDSHTGDPHAGEMSAP